MAFRVRRQGTQNRAGGPIRARAARAKSENEGVGAGVGGEALGCQSREEACGVAGALSGIAEAAPQDVRNIGLVARPPDPRHALAAHVGPIARKGGRVHAQPFANQGRVAVDSQLGSVAGSLHPEHEMAGGLVEVRVPRGVGGEGVGRNRVGDLRGGRAVQCEGEEEGAECHQMAGLAVRRR